MIRCAVCIVCLIAPLMGHAQLDKQLKIKALKIWQTESKTFFCDQPFDAQGKIEKQPCPDCAPIKQKIKWTPIVPPHEFAKGRLCFEEKACFDTKGNHFGGIRCCRKIDSYYQQMEDDLQNVVPENSEVSRKIQMYHFTEVKDVPSQSILCNLRVDQKSKAIEPNDPIKGIIARCYLYMHQQYQIPLSDKDKRQFYQWHQRFPPTKREIERNLAISQVKGQHANPFVRSP